MSPGDVFTLNESENAPRAVSVEWEQLPAKHKYPISESQNIIVDSNMAETTSLEERKQALRENIQKMKQQLEKQEEDAELRELLKEEQALHCQLSQSDET